MGQPGYYDLNGNWVALDYQSAATQFESAPPPEPAPPPAEPAPAPAPEAYGGEVLSVGGAPVEGAAPPQYESAPAPEPAPAPQGDVGGVLSVGGAAPEGVPPGYVEVQDAPRPGDYVVEEAAPYDGPLGGFGEAVGNALGALGGVKDALLSPTPSGPPEPAPPPRQESVGGVLVDPAARGRGQAAAEGRPIDRDRPDPAELPFVGTLFDGEPGDAFEDVGRDLGRAKDAIGSLLTDRPSLGEAGEALAEGLDYGKNVNLETQAGILREELTQGREVGVSPGEGYYDRAPLTQDVRSDPAKRDAFLTAFEAGYTKQDGTFVEPGERAAWLSVYDPLPLAEKAKYDAYYDPFLLPSLLPVGRAAKAAGQIPKVGRGVQVGLETGFGAYETVANLGLNVAVPAGFKGAGRLAEATGLGKPSARQLATEAADGGADAGAALVAAGRQEGAPAVGEYVERGAVATLRAAPEAAAPGSPAQIDAVLAGGGRGQPPVQVAGVVEPGGVVRPPAAGDFDAALGMLARLPEEQYQRARDPWFNAMMRAPDPSGAGSYLEPKAPPPGIDRPGHDRWVELMAERLKNFDRPGQNLTTSGAANATNRPVARGLFRAADRANQLARVLPGSAATEAERDLLGIEAALRKAGQWDDWAREEVNLLRARLAPPSALPQSALNKRSVRQLLNLNPSEFVGPAARKGRALLGQSNIRLDPAHPNFRLLEGLVADRLANPNIRKADLDLIGKEIERLAAMRQTPSNVRQMTAWREAVRKADRDLAARGLGFGLSIPPGATWRATGAEIRRAAAALPDPPPGPRPLAGETFDRFPLASRPEGTPWVPLRPTPLPTEGVYAPNSFSRKVGVSLGKEREELLSRVVNGTRVGDRALELAADIDRARALARGQAAGWELAAPELDELARLTRALSKADPKKTPPDLALLDDAAADALAQRLLRREIAAADPILGKPPPGGPAKAVNAVGEFLGIVRSAILYGRWRAANFVSMQAVGNAVTLLLGKPAALPDYFRPLEVRKGRRFLMDPNNLPDELKPASVLWRKQTGRRGVSTLGSVHEKAIGQSWLERDDSPALARMLGKALISPWGREWSGAFDFQLRNAAYMTTVRPAARALVRGLPDEAMRLAAPGAPVTRAMAEGAIDRLARAHGDAFSPKQLREALFEAAGGHKSANRQAAYDWADAVARRWDEGLDEIDRAAQAEVNRVGFDFRETNLDAALSKVFFYHFWVSRATVLYATEAAKNPWQLRAWSEAMRAADRREEEGTPGWKKTWVEFMRSPAGYVSSFDPVTLLGTLFFFQENGEAGPRQLTPVGEFFEVGLGSNLMLSPLIRAALYATGAMGEDANTPDLFGTRRLERKINDALEVANQLGNGFLSSQDGAPTQVRDIDSRAFLGWLAQHTAGLLPGTTEVVPFDPQRSQRDNLAFLVGDQIKARNPDLVARMASADPEAAEAASEEYVRAVNAALADPTSDAYQDALDVYVEMAAPKGAPDEPWLKTALALVAREASPFYMPTEVTSKAEAQERAARDEKTAEDRAFGSGVRYKGDETTQSLWAGFDAVYEGGVALEALLMMENPEWSTDEVAAAAEAERANPGELSRRAAAVQAAADAAKAIRDGTITEPLTVNGQTIDPATLAALSQEQRYRWQDAYLAEIGMADAVDAMYGAREAYLRRNPTLAGYWAFNDLARDYPGGTDLFIRDTADLNPGYARYLEGVERKGMAPGTPEWREEALKSYGYLAAIGAKTGPFDLTPNGNGKVAGLGENQSLASAYWARKEADAAEGSGDTAAKVRAVENDWDDMQVALAIAEKYGEGPALLNRVITGDTKTYWLGSYDEIKAALGYVPSGSKSDIGEYLDWLGRHPEADPGDVAGWYASGAAYEKARAERADDPLPLSPQGSSDVAAAVRGLYGTGGGTSGSEDSGRAMTPARATPLLADPYDPGSSQRDVTPGEELRELERGGDWMRVAAPDGATGWVPTSALLYA